MDPLVLLQTYKTVSFISSLLKRKYYYKEDNLLVVMKASPYNHHEFSK